MSLLLKSIEIEIEIIVYWNIVYILTAEVTEMGSMATWRLDLNVSLRVDDNSPKHARLGATVAAFVVRSTLDMAWTWSVLVSSDKSSSV